MSDIDKVKRLRYSTGLSFGEIKKALDESGGDEEEAKKKLQELGVKMASRKSSRSVQEGLIKAYVHNTGKVGTLVELLCETDFVAKNIEFQNLSHDLAMHITAMKPSGVDELLSQSFVKDPNITVQDLINQNIAKLGENIQVGRFEVLEI